MILTLNCRININLHNRRGEIFFLHIEYPCPVKALMFELLMLSRKCVKLILIAGTFNSSVGRNAIGKNPWMLRDKTNNNVHPER